MFVYHILLYLGIILNNNNTRSTKFIFPGSKRLLQRRVGIHSFTQRSKLDFHIHWIFSLSGHLLD